MIPLPTKLPKWLITRQLAKFSKWNQTNVKYVTEYAYIIISNIKAKKNYFFDKKTFTLNFRQLVS
jgi:hypothetical protein